MEGGSSQDVDAYIASAPKEAQGKLRELRTLVRQVAPTAVETVNYGMPHYVYHGRLVGLPR